MPDIDDRRRLHLARAFRSFLPSYDRAHHPTYVAICDGIAENDALLELADTVPAPQLPVNMLLAAVHDLLLRGADHVLATRYRSVCERRGLSYEATGDVALVAS